MSLLTQIASVMRDYAISGVPASGPHEPVKADIRALLMGIVTSIANGGEPLSEELADDIATLAVNLEGLDEAIAANQGVKAATEAALAAALALYGNAQAIDEALAAAAAQYEEMLDIQASGDDAAAIAARVSKSANGSDFADPAAVRQNIGADQAENIFFTDTGPDAVEQQLLARMRQMDALVTGYGVVGDGVHDDAPGIRAAIAANAGRRIYFPTPAEFYRCGSALGTLPYGTRLRGSSKGSTFIKRAFNGAPRTEGEKAGEPLLILADSSALEHLSFDGDGENRTGDLIHVLGTQGNQIVRDVRLVNSEGPCIYFEKDAGSRFTGDNIEAFRTDENEYAVVIEDVLTGGTPRSFNRLETAGHCSISPGGANNLYITNSSLDHIDFSPNNRDVTIMNSRLASQHGPYVLKGSGAILGGGLGPDVTCAPGAVWTVVPAYSNSLIYDESGGTSIVLQHKVQPYTPVIKAGGVAITLGAGGSVTGRYSRVGKLVRCKVRVVLGTGPTIPVGQLSFTLPIPTKCDTAQIDIGGRMQDSGGTFRRFNGTIAPANPTPVDTVLLDKDDAAVTGVFPGALGSGSGFDVTFVYET